MLNDSRWKELPVIASFDSSGNVKPLYVRIDGEKYRIISCREKQNLGTHFVFHAAVENFGKETPIELGFWPDRCVWCYCT